MLAERCNRREFEEGKAAERTKWLEWNKRLMEVQARCEEFNELPPAEAVTTNC